MEILTSEGFAYFLKAYLAWQNSRGQDPNPPGLQYTPQQMFFISHAQVRVLLLDKKLLAYKQLFLGIILFRSRVYICQKFVFKRREFKS